jgi:phospholipase C
MAGSTSHPEIDHIFVVMLENRSFDHVWLRRAHSVGNRRQLLNMITYALGVNALSMHVRRQGLAPPQAA